MQPIRDLTGHGRAALLLLAIAFAGGTLPLAQSSQAARVVGTHRDDTIASATAANSPRSPVTRCGPDAVLAGTVCLDRYEASVWRVPEPTTVNASLLRRIRVGTAARADLIAGGATQLGLSG